MWRPTSARFRSPCTRLPSATWAGRATTTRSSRTEKTRDQASGIRGQSLGRGGFMVKSFRDLLAWQRAIQLSVLIYRLTQVFPREELYGLTSQMRRSAVSVPSNIAEGHGRLSTGEYRQFLGIARGAN